MRRAALFLALLSACGAVTVILKPQRVEKVFEFNSGQGGSCAAAGQPFGSITFDVRALNEAAGIEPGMGCLDPGARFGAEAHVLDSGPSRTPGDACAGPRGTITLERIVLAYTWAGGEERHTLECPGTVFDLTAPGETLSSTLDGCLDRLGDAGSEFLRVGYNRQADALTITPEGSCSADACFYFQFSLRLKLLSGSATLGDCP